MLPTGQDFINMMKTIYPNLKVASGGREIVVRCPFCGDSKDQRHSHFYISVPITQEDLVLYDCKLCPAQGWLDDDSLRKLGCYDTNILVQIDKHNADVLALPKYKTLKNIDIYPLYNKNYSINKYTKNKLNYLNSRLGTNLSYNDAINLKIFFNLYDIINQNRLQLSRDKNICDQLDAFFIGFISYDNSFCTLRKVIDDNRIYQGINKRYIYYSLINKKNTSKSFYVIPTNIDVFNTQDVKIHISEGVMDILSIYLNLNNSNNNQSIYIAAGGKSYKQALSFILQETGIINYEIHLYPDNDVDDYQLNRLVLNKLYNLPSKVFIHRNSYNGEKDYGVPLERIKDSIRILDNIYGYI